MIGFWSFNRNSDVAILNLLWPREFLRKLCCHIIIGGVSLWISDLMRLILRWWIGKRLCICIVETCLTVCTKEANVRECFIVFSWWDWLAPKEWGVWDFYESCVNVTLPLIGLTLEFSSARDYALALLVSSRTRDQTGQYALQWNYQERSYLSRDRQASLREQ